MWASSRAKGQYKCSNNLWDRTKKTNEKLRVRSKNVAKNSLHIEGKAIDFAIREVSQKKLRSAAKDICSGGLGFYPGFIHIDSGPVRRWGIWILARDLLKETGN